MIQSLPIQLVRAGSVLAGCDSLKD